MNDSQSNKPISWLTIINNSRILYMVMEKTIVFSVIFDDLIIIQEKHEY